MYGLDQLKAVHFRHIKIGEHQIGRLALDGPQGLLTVGGRFHFESRDRENMPDLNRLSRAVLRDQDLLVHRAPPAKIGRLPTNAL